jgi:lactoylglutathione lyase
MTDLLPPRSYVELHVPDFEVVKEFYGKLGFRVAREDPASGRDGYLVMELDGGVVAFWPGTDEVYQHSHFQNFPRDTPRGFGVELAFSVENLEVVHRAALDMDCVVAPLVQRPWGLHDFRVVDPFGYYLRFTEQHNVFTSPSELST